MRGLWGLLISSGRGTLNYLQDGRTSRKTKWQILTLLEAATSAHRYLVLAGNKLEESVCSS